MYYYYYFTLFYKYFLMKSFKMLNTAPEIILKRTSNQVNALLNKSDDIEHI